MNEESPAFSTGGVSKDEYLGLDDASRKAYFYEVRSRFNSRKVNFEAFCSSWIPRAAEFIFLNKTCFNGMFRVNSKGEFNVPFGRYKSPTICDSENLVAVSEVLKRVLIVQGDFAYMARYIDSRTLVYLDPPYRPLSKTANFTGYSPQGFDDAAQVRLRDFFKFLDAKGAKVILSNSCSTDGFLESAYSGYSIRQVQARRSINRNGKRRGEIPELLITNF